MIQKKIDDSIFFLRNRSVPALFLRLIQILIRLSDQLIVCHVLIMQGAYTEAGGYFYVIFFVSNL